MELNQSDTQVCKMFEKENPLKFGIDRLLAKESQKSNSDDVVQHIAKPLPTIGVPCSDCVTSLFRCCMLSPDQMLKAQNQEYFKHQEYDRRNIYAMQPIKPFATRPGKKNILFNQNLNSVKILSAPGVNETQ